MDFYTAFYDMDENRVFVWMTDGKIVAINCTMVENAFANNLYERSELDYLIRYSCRCLSVLRFSR